MLNHAFLIYAHAYPEQLKEIIGLLSSDNHYFFVNIDRKAKWGEEFMKENKSGHVMFLKGKERMEIAHGGYSQIEVTLRLLHKAYAFRLTGGGYCNYFHLLSGQDYPVQSNKKFDEFFERNEGKSYMLFDTKAFRDKCMEKKYPSRVLPYYILDIPHRNNFMINFMVRGFDFISRRIWWRKHIPGLWGGWNWFSWHRQVAEYVIAQEKSKSAYFRRFHHTNCADELIFQTLLYQHVQELNIDSSNSLRYINWVKESPRKHFGSPLTLNEEEYNEIINSGAFFCRKIDPVISKKLKEMLRKIINGE